MSVRFTKPALEDLEQILEYIAVRSPSGAAKVSARIHAVLALIVEHQRVGIKTDDPTIRRINTIPYPYLLFYEVVGDDVIVHAVRHGARDPSSMPGSSE